MSEAPANSRALFEIFPALEAKAPFARLGVFPTPISSLREVAAALGHQTDRFYEKRDDLTSPLYGGNKVRTIEVLFGHALKRGSSRIFATGAYGSNHAAAMAMHAPTVGLNAGICVYPQPPSPCALENLELVLSLRPAVQDLPHWSALPYGIARVALTHRDAYVMLPGGAIPLGALGYVSAAFELAMQVEAGELPKPEQVVVAVGSNCTSAGLLLGLRLAADRGFFGGAPPTLVAVRVTPWPVTTPRRILGLAAGASRLLTELTGDASLLCDERDMAFRLRVDTGYIGAGYGFATARGQQAVALWADRAGHPLETTYSGKAAALVMDLMERHSGGPVLFWVTKSSAPMPSVDAASLDWAPRRMRRWMVRARAAG